MQTDVIVFDWETTISNKGNPFDTTNKAILLAIYRPSHGASTQYLKFNEHLDFQNSLAIAFNAKFDLHWLRREGLSLPTKIWDCQLAEFILNNQTTPYPSLNEACARYGIPLKLDVVATEYWDKGIDTDAIPREILEEYAIGDVQRTYLVYLEQRKRFENEDKHKYRLFQMCCADLLVLAEMEWNGLRFDQLEAEKQSALAKEQLNDLRNDILGDYRSLPINLGSGDHLSAFLYGGTITEELRVPNGVFKSGAKAGLPKYSILRNTFEFPRQFEPLEKSELKKEGYWSTDEATLRSLKGPKEKKKILVNLDTYAKLDKLNSTYYEGFNKLITKMNWPKDHIHGQFNQVVARTGRLSASSPNQQNLSPEAKKLFYTRYK